jgi:hypothetical protein
VFLRSVVPLISSVVTVRDLRRWLPVTSNQRRASHQNGVGTASRAFLSRFGVAHRAFGAIGVLGADRVRAMGGRTLLDMGASLPAGRCS